MTKSFGLALTFFCGIAVLTGCGPETGPSTTPSSGGASGTGSGGASTSSGGAVGSGGATSSGGAVGSGGATSSGGAVGSGGATSSGGAVGSGGRATGGSTTGSGGSGTASGGATATGGRANTGGAGTGTGGTGTGGTGTGGAGTGTGGAAGGSSGSGIWIAPDGNDSAAGTEAMPLKTLAAAVTKAAAGNTIWVKPGTYASSTTVTITKNGTEAMPFRIWAAAGARPLFDFSGETRGSSSARGIELKGDYWHIKGIDITKAGDNCIHITGAHNTIEWVVTRQCDDTGIQISVDSGMASDATRGANNLILNCDSYENFDTTTGGENADGFAAKLYIGAGNVFRGCRAWNNSDDGWDFFASNDVVTIDNCWAFANGKAPPGSPNPNGDGNGFKLGGAPTAGDANMGGAVHIVKNSFAFENNACGYVRNNNPLVPSLTMCSGRADAKGEFCNLTNSGGSQSFTMTTDQAKAAARGADGALPAIR